MNNKKKIAVRLVLVMVIMTCFPYGCTYTDILDKSTINEVNAVIVPTDRGEYTAPASENFPTPEGIIASRYAPMNNLRILDNMNGAKVEVVSDSKGAGVQDTCVINDRSISEREDHRDAVRSSLSQGDFYGNQGQETDTSIGMADYMYGSMRGSGSDIYFGGVAILFSGSSTDYAYPDNYGWCSSASDAYAWEYDEGWQTADRSLSTTTMKVKLKYTNVGYYKGRLIGAYATIRVTPSKNRNSDDYWDNGEGDGGDRSYYGTYHPMFQASNSLYRGWVWQNVKEFNVDLEFFYEDSGAKITLAQNNTDNSTVSYDSLSADYYVINSLNPVTDTSGDGETYPHYIGPEYVLPEQPVSNVYILDSGNIGTYYTIDNEGHTSYGYNGGTTSWTADDPTDTDWPKNSVMIMPKASDSFNFTMGQLPREPYDEYNYGKHEGHENVNPDSKRHTSSMWASFSTQPFTPERHIDIDITKNWDCDNDDILNSILNNINSITCNLKLAKTSSDETTQEMQSVELTADNGWTGQFAEVPGLEDEDYKYIIEEVVNYKDGTTIQYGFESTIPEIAYDDLEQLLEGTPETDGSYILPIEITNTPILGQINIVKKDDNGGVLSGAAFRLDKADNNWNVIETVGVVSETDKDGKIQFKNLDMGNYILTEVKAPNGYMPLIEPIKITIPYQDNDGKTLYELTYKITNGQAFSLPQTGACDYGWRISLGMFMIIISGLILTQRNYKRKIRK